MTKTPSHSPMATSTRAKRATLDVKDTEFSAKIGHTRDLFDGIEIEFGLQFEQKQRDTLLNESDTIEIDPLPEGTFFPPLSQIRPFTNFAWLPVAIPRSSRTGSTRTSC